MTAGMQPRNEYTGQSKQCDCCDCGASALAWHNGAGCGALGAKTSHGLHRRTVTRIHRNMMMTTMLLVRRKQTAPTCGADEGEAGHALGGVRGQAAGDHAAHGVPHHVRLWPAHVVLQGAAGGMTRGVG